MSVYFFFFFFLYKEALDGVWEKLKEALYLRRH